MAQFDSVDLQLNLIAKDQASDVLRSLAGIVDGLVKSIKSIGDIKDPFGQLQADADTFSGTIDGINTSLSTLRDNLKGFSSNPFTKVDESATTLSGDIDGANKSLRTFGDALKSFAPKNPFTGVDGDTTTLTGDIDAARTAWKDLGSTVNSFSVKNNPFSTLDTDLTTLITDLRTAISLMRELDSSSVPSGSSGGGSRTSGGTGVVKGSRTGGSKSSAPPDNYGAWFSNLNSSQIPEALMPSYNQAVDQWLGWGGATADETAPSRFYQEYNAFTQSQNPNPSPEGKKPKPVGFGTSELMSGTMDAMMGYYGLQTLMSSASNFEYIQELMQLGQGKSKGNYGTADVNNAASVYALLGMAGMTGSSGVDFMTGVNSNLENMFTQMGKGGLPKEALILQQAGFSQKDIAGSPWSTIQNIQQGYQTLLNKGLASQATQFLSITGTSQLAPMFANWGTAQQAVSGINLGMTGSQLNQAVTQDVSSQGAIQKLALEFDSLSQSMMPVVESMGKMATALSPFVTVLSNLNKNPVFNALNSPVKAMMDYSNWAIGLFTPDKASQTSYLQSQRGNLTAAQYKSDLSAVNGGQTPIMMYLHVFTQDIQNWAMGLWPAVQKDFTDWKKQITAWSGSLWTDVQKDFAAWKKNITGWSGSLWNDVQKDFAGWKKDLSAWSSALWGDVQKDFDAWKGDLTTWSSSLWSDVSSDFDKFTSNMVAWAQKLWNEVLGSAQSVVGNVEQGIDSVPGGTALVPKTTTAETQFQAALRTAGYNSTGTLHAVPVNHSGKISIEIKGTGGTAAEKQLAQQVAEQLMQKLKLTGNFDLSF